PAGRYRWNGSRKVRGGWTSTAAESAQGRRVRSAASRVPAIPRVTGARRVMVLPSSRSLSRGVLIAQHGDEQVGDARRADVAERGELLSINAIEQQDRAAEHLAL